MFCLFHTYNIIPPRGILQGAKKLPNAGAILVQSKSLSSKRNLTAFTILRSEAFRDLGKAVVEFKEVFHPNGIAFAD